MQVEFDTKITWQQHGPGNSGLANMLRYHPTVPGVAIFGPDMGGMYRSADNGVSWHSVRDSDSDAGFRRLMDLCFSVSDNMLALAIESSHLRVSNDQGQSWSLVSNCPWYVSRPDGSDRDNWKAKISTVAIDPTNANVWYVGAGKNPRGQDWVSAMNGATAATSRGRNNEFSGKIWKTTNGGAS